MNASVAVITVLRLIRQMVRAHGVWGWKPARVLSASQHGGCNTKHSVVRIKYKDYVEFVFALMEE